MFRGKPKRLVQQHLERRGLPQFWWQVAAAAIGYCEGDEPLEPLITGAGPMPARSVVALLGLEPFVEGGISWSLHDELTDPGGAFYPPNNDMKMPETELKKVMLQEWFFPSGDRAAFEKILNAGWAGTPPPPDVR